MTDEKRPLEARVAAILNARELAINKGKKDGVCLDMKFAVLAENSLQISDPGTGDVLDSVDREKTRVKVTELRPRIAICTTYRTKSIRGGPFGEGMASFLMSYHGEPETLSYDDSVLPPPLTEDESYVKHNDRVIQVFED